MLVLETNKQTNKQKVFLSALYPCSWKHKYLTELLKKKRENCTKEKLPYNHQLRKYFQVLENVDQLQHLDNSSYRERLCKKSELYHRSLLTPKIKHTKCSINIQCPGRAYVALLHFSRGGRGSDIAQAGFMQWNLAAEHIEPWYCYVWMIKNVQDMFPLLI